MRYEKPPLSLEQQADLLISRGLIADKNEMISRLKMVNYYRLSGYLFPFRENDTGGKRTEKFIEGTTFETVWRRHMFDHHLRHLVFEAISEIEVAVRTRVTHRFVLRYGAFGHLKKENLPRFSTTEHESWLGKLLREKERAAKNKNPFVVHFNGTYEDEHLPLWIACELMTCDTLQTFINATNKGFIKEVAADFGFPDCQFLSWTKAIFSLRNACAHHARIWNRVAGATPCLPGNKNKNPNWHIEPRFDAQHIGHALCVCNHWLNTIHPNTHWKNRLFMLFEKYPEIPLDKMGIPGNWREHPLWK